MWRPQLPPALRWDHNAHYHGWLLRQVPPGSRVLDVGCGTGELARRLSARGHRVDAVDRSAEMIDHARSTESGVRWLHGDVLDPDLPLDPAGYDAVLALSSLHHLPLRPALTRLGGLVRPGGRLAVVGLYRAATAADRALESVTLPANAAVGLVLAARGRAGKPHDAGMPMMDPTITIPDLRAAAAELLPGARVRRRLFWRHTLLWRRTR